MRRSTGSLLATTVLAGIIGVGSIARADDASHTTTTNNAATPDVTQPAGSTGPAGPTLSATDGPPANTAQSPRVAPSTSPTRPPESYDHGRFGAGAIVGEPTGLSLKYWLTDKTAVDGGIAWSFEDHDSFQLHADYLWHKFDLFPIDYGKLPLYFGVGGRVKIPDHGDSRAGVRLPVGVSFLFPDAPVELFAEVAPIIDVAPATQLRFNGGIGVRYYFW